MEVENTKRVICRAFKSPEDEIAVLELIRNLQEYELTLNSDLAKPTEEYCKNAFKSLIDESSSNEGIILVAQEAENTNPVGFIVACKEDDPSLYSPEYCWYSIKALSVNPSFRKKGIATYLLKKVEEYALEKGVKQLRVNALAANEIAVSLYQAKGFSTLELILKKEL